MDRQHPSSFGALLRGYREVARLTQADLAERAGLTAKGISALERGERQRPYRDTVSRLVAALGLEGIDRATFEASASGRAIQAADEDAAPAAAPPLVGRARERLLLERHLAGSGPPVLFLAGEPGIGKTRLLDEAAALARRGGWTVLRGGCRLAGGERPFAPLTEALAEALRAFPLPERGERLRERRWLARVLPELGVAGAAPEAGTLPPDQERRLIAAAARDFLADVAGASGSLLLLDDLHWAGADALNLLVALLREPAPAPLRLVGAYRNTERGQGEQLNLALGDLAQAGLATQQTVVPLPPEEARRLLDALLSDVAVGADLRERVARQAEGVPFFLVSSAQALRSGAVPMGDGILPWDLAATIRQRLAALTPTTQETLRWAAVIGRVVDPELLRAVAALPDAELFAALDEACAAGLLAETASAYTFVHDVIRDVIEAEIGLARRQASHRAIAEVLEREVGDAGAEALAYHYGQSAARAQAWRYLELAGDRAWLAGAPSAAEGHYRDLVARLEAAGGAVVGSPRTLDAARAREKLGGVLFALARYEEAQAAFEPCVPIYRTGGDLERLGAVTATLAGILVERGRPAEGMARLEEVRRLIEAGGPSRTLAQINGALAHLLFHSGQLAEALAVNEQGVALARELGDPYLVTLAQLRRGNALRMAGRVAEALPVMEEALGQAELIGEPTSLLFALDNLAWVEVARGNFAQARHYNARACLVAERLAAPAQSAGMIAARGAIAFLLGTWRQAHRDLEAAVAVYRRIDAVRLSAYPLAELGRLLLAMGDADGATAALAECVAIAGAGEDLQALRLGQGMLAECDILAGRPRAARDRLCPLLDRPGMCEWQVTELLPTLAWAHLDLGDGEQAVSTAEEAIERARSQTNALSLAHALRIRGLIAVRQGRPEEARAPLAEALALARRMPYPYGEARILQAQALAAAAVGDEAWERACLDAAARIAARLASSAPPSLGTIGVFGLPPRDG
jgi:tetratricopeptide (TPR) repeat protein/transcriptional regulator with XRE-family HTH domain